MTTHYEKIQALGNRMADNLTTMGISSSFSEGGLTLADKILQIQHFTNGILLVADKLIEQSSNTIKFTALVLKEGVAQAGKKVHFKGLYTNEITINSSSSNVDLGENGWIITLTGGTAKIGTLSKLLHITKTNSGYNVGVQSAGSTTNLQGSYVYYDGSSKILYSDVASLDLSNATGINEVDFTNLYSADSTFGTIGGVVRLPLYATTNSYGVATAEYTCSGAGVLNVQAISGNVQSTTYTVTDALFYDSGTTGTPNTKWVKNGGAFNATSDDTGLLIENTFTWAVYYRADLTNDTSTRDYSAPFKVEFDLIDYSGTGSNSYITFDDGQTNYPALRFDATEVSKGCHISIRVVSEGVYYKIDDGTETRLSNTITGNCHVSFQMSGGTDKYIKFKNFKVYPI